MTISSGPLGIDIRRAKKGGMMHLTVMMLQCLGFSIRAEMVDLMPIGNDTRRRKDTDMDRK